MPSEGRVVFGKPAASAIPHGHTSCIMLPAVMWWNKPVNAEWQAMISAAMGHPGDIA